ncbi:MAG: hypothetical protein UR22_C0003G0003 [Parcubacteria group bacterium GW2011_GWC2_32_10]|nr:MAG: hypothetical protein UR22_C0003G0003 [Parcubacteria group bacterium GW2011_GWC2_32_10]
MDIEYEATFTNIDKNKYREKLAEIGAKLIKLEFLQKRVTFKLPDGHEIKGGFLRVRDENDKITMSLKVMDGDQIENQKEICLQVDNFKKAEDFLLSIGCVKKSYQETKRELWMLDGVEVTIDEWPFLEPLIEIEGISEESVKIVSKKLGFNYADAFFGATGTINSRKYNLSEDIINNHTPEIVFDGENPFLKSKN